MARFLDVSTSYGEHKSRLISRSGATLGWAGLISVDGTTYSWMGDTVNPSVPSADQVSYNYTSSSSTYVLSVNGAVQITATFLSPITPDDFKRQSLIFSYLNVEVVSLDGKTHDVSLYTDISGGEFFLLPLPGYGMLI